MINLNLDYLNRFLATKREKLNPERLAARFRGVVIETYMSAVKEVPQFSGHMASNLRISVNGSAVTPSNEMFNPGPWQGFRAYQKGSSEAIAIANSHNSWINSRQAALSDVYELKYADGAESEYFDSIESGSGKLRDVNRPSMAILRAGARIKSQYSGAGAPWTRLTLEKNKI